MMPSHMIPAFRQARCLAKALPLILVFCVAPVSWLTAAETDTPVPAIDPVVVVGTVEIDAIGRSTLSRDTISQLPTEDGNIENVIKLLPGTQLSDESDSSFQGGEILPPLISISGGRPYENNFLIDGLGNNSLLDPGSELPAGSPIDVPGHPQEIFLDTRLAESIEVLDNNVPAKYGGFAGGVVAAGTIDPGPEPAASIRYRTTRDQWTEFHLDPADRADFENSFRETRQPNFEKHDVGLDLNLPLTEDSGLFFAWQSVYSEIPLLHFGQTVDQSRRSQNFLKKFVQRFPGERKLSLQAIYNPYEGDHFLDRTRDSRFTIKRGGFKFGAEYEKLEDEGHWRLSAGLGLSHNSRNAPRHHRNWDVTDNKNWGATVGLSSSREGGFGDIDKEQMSYEFAADWLSDTFFLAKTGHQVNSGVQASYVSADFVREQTSYAYRRPESAPDGDFDPSTFSCGEDTFACDDTPGSEQFFPERNVYQAVDVDAAISSIAFYLDDTIDYNKLTLRPGLRISYDDFMKNTNVAPRFAAKYDLFGDGTTLLIGGWNRYYSRTLLTYKLREAIIPKTQERLSVINNQVEWIDKSLVWPSRYQYSSLKTPFSDEVVAGINQHLLGGRLDLRYVSRHGDDEFARERDSFDFSDFNATLFIRLNNNGESHYESYRLAWERQWVSHYLGLNATYSQTTTSNGTYDDTLEPDDFDPDDRIWFDGELLWPDELPREDFNRPWIATLVYSCNWPHGLKFTNVTRFRSGYKGIEETDDTITINGIDHVVYKEFDRDDTTVFDWKISWTPGYSATSPFTLTLEALNVFNAKPNVGAETDEFELGRRFWIGAEYRF